MKRYVTQLFRHLRYTWNTLLGNYYYHDCEKGSHSISFNEQHLGPSFTGLSYACSALGCKAKIRFWREKDNNWSVEITK